MTRDEYASICGLIGGLWPSNKWGMETIVAGERLLLDLPVDAALAAVEQLAADGERYAPNPGQVRKAAVELAARASGDCHEADEALAEVFAAVARIGYYRRPEWSHPAIASTVEALGGWQAVCLDENPEAFRAHFLRLYGVAATRVARERVAPDSVRELVTAGLDLSLKRLERP